MCTGITSFPYTPSDLHPSGPRINLKQGQTAGIRKTVPFGTGTVPDGRVHFGRRVEDARCLQQVRVATALGAAKPEIVLHLAAQPLVRRAFANPVETYGTNVMGTVNLLEALRLTEGVRAAVIVTTDKVYENREWAWGYAVFQAIY